MKHYHEGEKERPRGMPWEPWEDDEGELQMAVGVRDGVLMIAFPVPVMWIGLGHAEALALAALIARRAEELKPKEDEPDGDIPP